MISIDQDVQIVYNEQDAGNLRTSTHNLVFLEDLSKSLLNSDFAVEISDPNGISTYSTDSSTRNFVNDFFAQKVRPNSFWLVCASIDSTSGILTTGYLPDEEDFFNSLFKDGEYKSVAYTMSFGQGQTLTCCLPGELLEYYADKECADKIYKLQLIGSRSLAGIEIETREISVEENKYTRLLFSTVKTGEQDGQIGYLEVGDGIETPGMIICKSPYHSDFQGFKEAIKGENNNTFVKIKITKVGGDWATYNTDITNVNSWGELAAAMTAEHPEAALVYAAVDLDSGDDFTLLFKTVVFGDSANIQGIVAVDTFPINALIGEAADLIIAGETINYDGTGPNITTILNGTQDSPGVQIQEGETINKGDSKVMQRFAQVMSSNNVNPNAIVLSRNLNFDLNTSATNINWTSNYIEGFNSFFGKNVSLVLQTSKYQIENSESGALENPFKDWLGDANGRNIIINYYTSINHYLDGAVAAYMTGIDFDGVNTLRNFKGLDFSRILPESDITDGIAKKLDEYQMNYYAIMSNGMRMYRQGTTYSVQDVKWIDTNTALNALIIDMKDALISLIKNGKVRMNDGGASKIYSSIANVCDKYVNNGFLSATTKTTSIDGQQVSVVVPPYKIDVSRSFTENNLSSRNFPQVNVYLASSSFVNVIKVNLSNMLISEVI